jgi:acyl carrier protein
MELLQVVSVICDRVKYIAEDKGTPVGSVGADTILLGGIGLDSLDLAAIVVELQEMTGKDPFHEGFIEFRTVHELAVLFSNHNG